MIELCLSVFEWFKFRKKKSRIKLYTLYDIEAEVPHLCILQLPTFTTQRLCLRFHSNLEHITYLTVDITNSATSIRYDMKLERSVYEILQILGIYLTYKIHLSDLSGKSNFKNFKDLYDSSEPNLFNLVHFFVDCSEQLYIFNLKTL